MIKGGGGEKGCREGGFRRCRGYVWGYVRFW